MQVQQFRQSSLTSLLTRYLTPLLVLVAIIAISGIAHAQPFISGVTATATSSQVFQASVLTNDNGLTEVSPGSGVYQLLANAYAYGGAEWNSGYTFYGPDENPYVQFDLGATYPVGGFRVWNFNEVNGYTFRGFREVTVQTSLDGTTWKSVAQRFVFAKAPGVDTYVGEEYEFKYPVTARYIRFICDSTHRFFAGRELAGLGKVRFRACGRAVTPPSTGGIFPSDSGVINIKLPPYNAVGDGIADDSDALQKAINDWQGSRQIIYLPAGTYKVTRSIKLASFVGFGFTNLRGESMSRTKIVLADNTFTDPNNPQPVLSAASNRSGSFVSADWFNNNFGFFTINVGSGNPGAVGLQFYANNAGSVRNVTFTSNDGGGKIGLDLGYDDQNGPLLAKNITVNGYGIGVNAGYSVNSQVLENITINSPSGVGIRNGGQCLSIRNYTFTGAVTALDSAGFAVLVGANFTYTGGSATPAIINNEGLFARSVTARNFSPSIQNNFGGTPNATNVSIGEYVSHPILSQFSTRLKSLRLAIKSTPDAPLDALSKWANVRNFRLVSDPDDTLAVQRAIDSGATTVYFPSQGTYYIDKVYLRGAARRIVGMQASISRSAVGGGFQIEEGTPTTVWIDQVGGFNNRLVVNNKSSRTFVGRDLQDPSFTLTGTGETFLENVSTEPITLNPGQKLWARQLNIEGSQTKIVNNGGTFWALGFKSEAGGTLIATTGGGKSELLGGLYYSQTSGAAPMFTSVDSSVSLSIAEVNFAFDPFQLIVQETRGGVTRTLGKSDVPQRRFVPGSMLPLYVGYYDATFLAPPYNIQAMGGASQIALTWDVAPGATSYIIRRATTVGGTYSTIATVTTNSYVNTGLTPGTTYYYKLTAIYPTGTSAASSPVSATANVAYRINSGGGAIGAFSSDAYFVGGNTAGNGNPIDTSGVTNPAPPVVYQSERWGNFSYNLTGLTAGASYKLRLHFAEIFFSNAGRRVFSVAINGAPALTNFDIIAAVGAPNKAVVREFTTTADATGKITLNFTATVDAAKISGIEVSLP